MSRKDELLGCFTKIDEDKKTIVMNLIDDVIHLEDQLKELRKLPFIKVNVANPQLQKSTPAGKLYKEMLQQYNNCIKLLCSVLSKNEGEDISPLREYLRRLNG